jgi:AcrR family transcriptional regulator
LKTTPNKPPLALREQNKLDKRERIRAAAAELFTRQGYADATMRQIAHHAHVGLGTLFNYAADKRDLVFLIFNEELGRLTDAVLAEPDAGLPLVGQLTAIFSAHYRYFGSQPELSRILLQELTFYSQGKHALEFQQIRQRLIAGIEARVVVAQAAGQLRGGEPPELIARLLFFVYSAAVRWWIAAPRPDAAKGLAELRRLLQMQMDGLAPPDTGAPGSTRAPMELKPPARRMPMEPKPATRR